MCRFAKIILSAMLLAGSSTFFLPARTARAAETTGTITGRVTSSSQPGGVKNVLVYSYDLDRAVADIAYTDASGNYTLTNMETGDFVVRFETRRTSTAYLDQWYTGKGSFHDAASVKVVAGQNTPGVNAVLQPGSDNRLRAAIMAGSCSGYESQACFAGRYLEEKGFEVEWLLSTDSDGGQRGEIEWDVIKEGLSGAKIIFYSGHGIYYGAIPNCRVGGFYALDHYFGYPELSTIDFDENAVIMFAHACFTAGNYSDPAPSTQEQKIGFIAMYANDFMGWERGDYFNVNTWKIDYSQRNLGFSLYYANNMSDCSVEALSMLFSADYSAYDILQKSFHEVPMIEDPFRYNDENDPANPMHQDYRMFLPEGIGNKAVVGNMSVGMSDIIERDLPDPASVPYISNLSTSYDYDGAPMGYINGSRFGEEQGSSYVMYGSTPVYESGRWLDNHLTFRIPQGVYGNSMVTIVTDRGTSNGKVYYVGAPTPPPDIPAGYDTTFYFAEGSTRVGFQEFLCLSNPTGEEAGVQVVSMLEGGYSNVRELTLPANSRSTINVNSSSMAPNCDVSLRVASDQPIIAERPMYFSYNGLTGGHDVIGASSPSSTWYFAEGYTGYGFEEFVCVLNPGNDAADITFRFQTQQEGEVVRSGYNVPAHARSTFRVNDVLGSDYECSLKLESSRPVVAERPMYFDYTGPASDRHWDGGHCVIGTTALADTYYFAEGTTHGVFEEYLTLQNPNNESIKVEAFFQLGKGQGAPISKAYQVDPGRRYTVYVPNEVGRSKDVSVMLSSGSQFLAERPMYFNYDNAWTGGHCVIGSTGLGTDWFFAEGYTGDGFHEWLCLQNPGETDCTVDVTYYTQEVGALAPKEVKVPARTRVTIRVNDHAGPGYQLSTGLHVKSGPGIVAERPMYFNYDGSWTGGHDVVGYQP